MSKINYLMGSINWRLQWLMACLGALLRGVKPVPFELWYDGYPLGTDEWEDTDPAWLCDCGHYEESGFHCSICGAEPPWGCDCSDCDDAGMEQDDWLLMWSDYPGDLLPGDTGFGERSE